MGTSQGTVSLTRGAVALATLACANIAFAQPTELGCGPASCIDVSHGDLVEVSCPNTWTLFQGRIAYAPLRYVGPIGIAVDARRSVNGFWLPLYVECVRVADHPPQLSHCDGVASVIWQVTGHDQCNAWETRDSIDLSYLLSPGDLYVIRLHFVASQDFVGSEPRILDIA